MSKIIEIDQLSFTYAPQGDADPVWALKDISLSVEKGSFVAVLGHNGCGKSTLAKQMNAVLMPTNGTVLVGGINTRDESRLFDIRRMCGMVFQNPDNQIVASVVEEDVAFAPENLGVPSEEIRARVDSALRMVGMEEYRLHAPHLLSGGQKQRVAIAGVLAMQPECIVLDEPTAMLDPQGRRDVMEIIHRLHKEGTTIVLITHHMQEAAQAERVIVMDHGTVAADGTPREVFSRVELMESIGLSVPDTVKLLYEMNRHGYHFPLTALTEEECAEQLLRAGFRFNLPAVREEPMQIASQKSAVLETVELTHVYSQGTSFEHCGIRNISLSVQPGEFIGLIGHTGSGKSTLIQHLNGLLKPTSGSVMLNGEDLNRSSESRRNAHFKVGLVFQYPEYQLFEETASADIAYGPANMKLPQDMIDSRVQRAAELVGLSKDVLKKSPFDLSGGQKRRVAIAGVLAMEPEVLILDEPTAGLDPQGAASILEMLRDFRCRTGASIIMVSHSMEEVAAYADRIVVLNHAELSESGTPGEIFSHAAKLTEMGLDIPQITSLFLRLESLGLKNCPSVYTVSDAVTTLCAAEGGGSV